VVTACSLQRYDSIERKLELIQQRLASLQGATLVNPSRSSGESVNGRAEAHVSKEGRVKIFLHVSDS
jgi:hypothetical protein